MKGNEVVLASPPKGHFIEGIIDGTPLPGTIMQLKAATAPVGGRHTWEVYNQSADGVRGIIAVLREDHLQGKTVSDAYVSGSRGFLYCPIMGEELNVRVSAAGTGTGDAVAIGDKFMVDDGTGLLVAVTGAEQSAPFQAMEALTDVVVAGTMTWCIYTGY